MLKTTKNNLWVVRPFGWNPLCPPLAPFALTCPDSPFAMIPPILFFTNWSCGDISLSLVFVNSHCITKGCSSTMCGGITRMVNSTSTRFGSCKFKKNQQKSRFSHVGGLVNVLLFCCHLSFDLCCL
jgi:hypothetical protein